jgi:exonuclease VII small subunit
MTETMAPEWYEAMAKAVKAREHAQTMITKWQEKLAAAEATIQQISSGNVPEQEQTSDANV